MIVVLGIAAVAIARRDGALHAMGGLATLLVFGVWLATSYATTSWQTVAAFAVVFAAVFAAAPFVADRCVRPLPDIGSQAWYVAPILLFTIAVIVRIEPQTEAPLTIFAAALRHSRDRGVAGVHGRGRRAVLRGSVLRAGG